MHHAAQGLAVRDAAVQLLHPDFQRAGVARLAHGIDALGQAVHALGAIGMVEIAVVERGLKVEQRGGHLHRQVGRRLGVERGGVGHRHLHGPAQQPTVRVEPGQRIGHQRKLLGQAGHAGGIAPGHGRPHLFGSGYAFSGLRHPGRVEAAQPGAFVIGGLGLGQLVALAHRGQARPDRPVVARRRLGTEKQQILGQPLRRGRRLTGAQLGQQLGAHALAVGIGLQQAVGLGLEKPRRQLPQRGQPGVGRGRCGPQQRRGGLISTVTGPLQLPQQRAALGPGGQPGKQLAHAGRHAGRRTAHHHQQIGLNAVERGLIGVARHGIGVERQLAPGPGMAPQISRMNPRGTGQLLQGPVLRKQRQRGHRLAGQAAVDEFQQRKGAVLNGVHRRRGDELGLAADAQQGGLGGPQQLGRRPQAHQFEHAHALVQLAARLTQHRGVDGVEVAALLLLFQIAAQRLVGNLQ